MPNVRIYKKDGSPTYRPGIVNKGWFVEMPATALDSIPSAKALLSQQALLLEDNRIIESRDNFERTVRPVLESSGVKVSETAIEVEYSDANEMLKGRQLVSRGSKMAEARETSSVVQIGYIDSKERQLTRVVPNQMAREIIPYLPSTARGGYDQFAVLSYVMPSNDSKSFVDKLTQAGISFSESSVSSGVLSYTCSRMLHNGELPRDLLNAREYLGAGGVVIEKSTGEPILLKVTVARVGGDTSFHGKSRRIYRSTEHHNSFNDLSLKDIQRLYRLPTAVENVKYEEMRTEATRLIAKSTLLDLGRSDVIFPEMTVDNPLVLKGEKVLFNNDHDSTMYPIRKELFKAMFGDHKINNAESLVRVDSDTIYLNPACLARLTAHARREGRHITAGGASVLNDLKKYQRAFDYHPTFVGEESLLPGAKITLLGDPVKYLGKPEGRVISLQNSGLAMGASQDSSALVYKQSTEIDKGNLLKVGDAIEIDGEKLFVDNIATPSIGLVKYLDGDGKTHITKAEDIARDVGAYLVDAGSELSKTQTRSEDVPAMKL